MARLLCLLPLLGLTVAIAACASSSSDAPAPDAAPTCKSGFRSQCVGDVAVGAGFGCALLADRTVWCWGRNDEAQLGYATTDLCPEDIGGGKTRSIACHTFPFRVLGLPDVTAIASGDSFTCALATDGSVHCWGSDTAGQLGNGSSLTSPSPQPVASLANVSALALGSRHACAIVNGNVSCWGANDQGQLGVKTVETCTAGSATIACATKPLVIPDLANVVELSAGANHTCARTGDGLVTCWGDNRWGQLGDGKPGAVAAGALRPVLTSVDTRLGAVLSLSAGAYHTCALRDGGDVLCWGRADHRELGAPPPGSGAVGCADACSTLAIQVPGLPSTTPGMDGGIDGGDGGDSGDAAARADARVDALDASADAPSEASEASVDAAPQVPEAGPPLGAFGRVLTSGNGYSCLRVDDGTVRCWGLDTVGQLGDGRATSEPSAPVSVIASPGAAATNPLQGVVRVRAGATSACAIMTDDSIRCWGSNQGGALGFGHFTPQQGPVPVSW